MEKIWIVIPTWRVERYMVERWNSLCKYHKYKGEKYLERWHYAPHFQCSGWWTHSQWTIPFQDKSKIVVTVLWNLTPDKGWLSKYAITIEHIQEKFCTFIDPTTADKIIHLEYFPCFTDQAIRGVLLGFRIQACYFPRGHKGQVGSLQYLALQAHIKYLKHGRRTVSGESSSGASGSRRGRVRRVATKESLENQPRGPVTLPPRVPFPSLEHLHGALP
ncbi:vif protein [Simian immunodeficiency virus]|uniref:Virion infectivity factor n=1 Tax=Simian immunodeficiency virus TaxID=11723 RepID=A0A0A7RS39_SIV|nr:vif protein [Simian immunodeficiency virus]